LISTRRHLSCSAPWGSFLALRSDCSPKIGLPRKRCAMSPNGRFRHPPTRSLELVSMRDDAEHDLPEKEDLTATRRLFSEGFGLQRRLSGDHAHATYGYACLKRPKQLGRLDSPKDGRGGKRKPTCSWEIDEALRKSVSVPLSRSATRHAFAQALQQRRVHANRRFQICPSCRRVVLE